MRLHFIISAILLGAFPGAAFSQCLSGNCTDGTGKYDFGYAIYEGQFQSGKPHGEGTMDYGGGEKYVGAFVKGQEEGDGILHKGNTQKAVTYRSGVMQERKAASVVIGGNKVQYDGGMDCTGDCYDGAGTAKFPSGNVYTGRFKNGVFHGQGTMRFASGNVLKGEFENRLPKRGTFTYAADGTIFTGTFNPDGTPASGTYSSKATGGLVEVSAGAITKVSNPRLDSIRAAQPKYALAKCGMCSGRGFSTTTTTRTEQLTPAVYRAHSSGFADKVYDAQVLKTSSTSFTPCRACGGKGQTMEQVPKR